MAVGLPPVMQKVIIVGDKQFKFKMDMSDFEITHRLRALLVAAQNAIVGRINEVMQQLWRGITRLAPPCSFSETFIFQELPHFVEDGSKLRSHGEQAIRPCDSEPSIPSPKA